MDALADEAELRACCHAAARHIEGALRHCFKDWQRQVADGKADACRTRGACAAHAAGSFGCHGAGSQ